MRRNLNDSQGILMHSLFNNIGSLIQTNPFLAFIAVFLAGVGVSFTPCVYPVIPLTLGFIGARSAGSRSKGFLLSLVYVLGMALTYAVLGAFAALTGKLFGQIGSNPWTYFLVANVCFVFGISMLGAFEIPSLSIGIRNNSGRGDPTGRPYAGAFIIGIFSGLIVGPCTAPVLATILVYVGTRQNVLYGFGLLFVFGYGVGFLMILLGTFTGLFAALPKSGAWLERVKKIFGCILVLAGEYLLIKMGGRLR